MDDTKGRNRVKSYPIKCNAHRGHIRKEYTFLVQYSNSQKGELFVEKKKLLPRFENNQDQMVHFSLFFVNNIFTTKKRSGFLNMELRGCFSPKSSDFWYFKMMKRGEEERGRFLKKKK